jgi:hypothetical protein
MHKSLVFAGLLAALVFAVAAPVGFASGGGPAAPAASDDHGHGIEPGDDKGALVEPGDDRGTDVVSTAAAKTTVATVRKAKPAVKRRAHRRHSHAHERSHCLHG